MLFDVLVAAVAVVAVVVAVIAAVLRACFSAGWHPNLFPAQNTKLGSPTMERCIHSWLPMPHTPSSVPHSWLSLSIVDSIQSR